MSPEEKTKKNILIAGLGLLGTSLAMALENSGHRIMGWTRREDVRNSLLAKGIIDITSDDFESLAKKADITVLCLPIPEIRNYGKKYAEVFKKGSIVTDVGSIKEAIVVPLEKTLHPEGVFFVGGHPMAGTEKSGHEAAFPELYRGASVFVTKTPDTNRLALEEVEKLWKQSGTNPVVVTLKEHDSIVAHTSHVQHLAALAITLAVLDCGNETLKSRYAGCAGGFKDTSRITSSSPEMWKEIIANNQPAVLEAVKEFDRRWKHLIEMIENEDYEALYKEFAKGKGLRDKWMESRGFA
jgi:prephenate dehydrogenase